MQTHDPELPFQSALRIGRARLFGLNRYDELLEPSRAAAAALASHSDAIERLVDLPHAAAACELAVEWLSDANEPRARRIEDALIRLAAVRGPERMLQCRALFQVGERLGRMHVVALRLAARALRWDWLAYGLDRAPYLDASERRRTIADGIGRAVVDTLALRNGVLRRELPLDLGRAAAPSNVEPSLPAVLAWVDAQVMQPWLRARAALDEALLLLPDSPDAYRLHLPVPGTPGFSLLALDSIHRDLLAECRAAEAIPPPLRRILGGPDEAREKYRRARARVAEAWTGHAAAIRSAAPISPPALEPPPPTRAAPAVFVRRGDAPWELSDEDAAHSLRSALTSPESGQRLFTRWAQLGEARVETAGGVFSTFADCTLAAARAFPSCLPEVPVPHWPLEREPMALDAPPLQVLGRTLVFAEDPGFRAVKLQRAGEPVSALLREAAWLATLQHELESALPRPLAVRPVRSLGADAASAIAAAGIGLAPAPWCLSYGCPERGYWRYVDALAADERAVAVARAAADLFTLLRRGVVHRALTVKNHSTGVEGDRRYEWMIDVMAIPSDRFGMGRLDAVPRVCTYPNVRATGLADLAELAPLRRLPEHAPERGHTFASPRLDPVANLGWYAPGTRDTLRWMRFAGDYLFDLTVLIVYARHRRSEPRAGLEEELTALWIRAWRSWTNWDRARAQEWLDAVIDFGAMAAECTTALADLGEREDIGPHNGPLGLVALERALHVFVSGAATAATIS